MIGVEFALLFCFVLLVLALLRGVPVGLCLAGAGVLTLLLIAGLAEIGLTRPGLMPSLEVALRRSLGALPERLADGLFGGSIATLFLSIPMFIVMGAILQESGVAAQLFTSANRVSTARFPNLSGRMALVVVLVAVLLSATTGVVGASVATLALLGYPALRDAGAGPELSSGLVIASGTLGQIIPPSIVLVILSVSINEFYAPLHPGELVEVFELFVAAIIPGLILAIGYAVYAVLRWPTAEKRSQQVEPASARDWLVLCAPVALVVSVLGSILLGFATLSKAASVGVAGAIILGLCFGNLGFQGFWQAFVKAAQMWGNIGFILIGALVLNLSLKTFGGDLYLQDLIAQIHSPWLLLVAVLALFFIAGFFLEFVEMTALFVPVFGPVLFASDLDPVWIGVLISLVVQTSFLTPPMGLSLFYFQSAFKPGEGPTTCQIYRGVSGFIGIQLVVMFGCLLAFAITSAIL